MRVAIILTASFATLSARDLVPEHWIENVPATNDSIQTSLVFRSVAGVAYRVETSDNLVDWDTDGEFYGLGHDIASPMREFTPAPPPDPGAPPPAPPPTKGVSLVLQSSSESEGGTIVSWKSLDDGGPKTFLLEENLHEDWDSMPLYFRSFGDYRFFIFRRRANGAPPSEEPSLGMQDSAMIEELESSFAAMNLEVANAVAASRNAPPPAPPAPGARKFWRIHADWSVDTDGDGSYDWEEFETAGNSSHPSFALGDAFNADVNENGTPDGDEADTDQDGIANANDADRANGVVNWQRADDIRFAWFEVPPTESPWGGEQYPIQVTDGGHVVYRWGLWSSGAYEEIARSGNRTDNCSILSVYSGTLGHIVGLGNYDYDNDGFAEMGCMMWWKNGSPQPVMSGDYFASYPFPYYPSSPAYGQYLGRDGGFVANVFYQGSNLPQMSRWELPWPGTNNDPVFGPVDQWVQAGMGSGFLWGGNQATIGGVTTTLPGAYQRMALTPGNSALAFSDSAKPALYKGGSWTEMQRIFGPFVG